MLHHGYVKTYSTEYPPIQKCNETTLSTYNFGLEN